MGWQRIRLTNSRRKDNAEVGAESLAMVNVEVFSENSSSSLGSQTLWMCGKQENLHLYGSENLCNFPRVILLQSIKQAQYVIHICLPQYSKNKPRQEFDHFNITQNSHTTALQLFQPQTQVLFLFFHQSSLYSGHFKVTLSTFLVIA